MTSPLSLIGEEAVARAINPAEWSWYDKAPDDPAAPSFRAQSLNRARAAMSAHLAALTEAGWMPMSEFLECALYDALMEGPRFKGWNRSALDRLRQKYEAIVRAAAMKITGSHG